MTMSAPASMSISTSRSASSTLAGSIWCAAPVAELRRRNRRRRGTGRRTPSSTSPSSDMMPVPSKPRCVERRADGGDAAVHHVGRRHEVGAGLGVRHRGLDQTRHGGVVDHVLAVHDAAVAVRRVLAQAHVGRAPAGRGTPRLIARDRRLHRRVGGSDDVEPIASLWAGRPNSSTPADAERLAAARPRLHGLVDRQLGDPGHRRRSAAGRRCPSQTKSG